MSSSMEAKLLKTTRFPPEYSKKVNMGKVNLEVMKQFVSLSWNGDWYICCFTTADLSLLEKQKVDLFEGHRDTWE
jgi:hypothetical protein